MFDTAAIAAKSSSWSPMRLRISRSACTRSRALPAARRRGIPRWYVGLPAELAEPLVADAEMVADLVDDSTAHLVADLILGAADRADRQAVDGDPVGQHPGVV